MVEVKHTTLELTVSSDYILNWDAHDALRELMQNAKDADDKGYKMSVRYTPDDKRLRIINTGVVLDRTALLLGMSTKREDSSQRGSFGEGFKLAWLVLLRSGYKVWAKSGSERWSPTLAKSERFGAELLKVQTAPVKYQNIVRCDVIGIEPKTWAVVKSRLLFMTPPPEEESIQVGRNSILLGDTYRNSLYVKGIYVSELPHNYQFGYDLWDVSLDRDRKLANPWDIRFEVKEVLKKAVIEERIEGKAMFSLLNQDCEESRLFEWEAAGTANAVFFQSLKEVFVERYGKGSCPVSSIGEAVTASHYGKKGVILRKGLVKVLTVQEGGVEAVIKASGDMVSCIKQLDEIENVELVLDAAALVSAQEPRFSLENLKIVEFRNPDVKGLYRSQEGSDDFEILLVQMGSFIEYLKVLVHEVAHIYGEDGSVSHRDACDTLYAAIIAALLDK